MTRILYFAWLREKIGAAEEALDVPDGVETVGALMAWLRGLDARHAAAFAEEGKVRCAVNLEFVKADAPIRGAKEIAFFPPVTGG